jgi:hypothetical protein
MADCISEYNFQLYIDPYDTRSAVIGDTDGTVVATVNRFATRHGDGFAVARLLRAAPAMLKALEVARCGVQPAAEICGVDDTGGYWPCLIWFARRGPSDG